MATPPGTETSPGALAEPRREQEMAGGAQPVAEGRAEVPPAAPDAAAQPGREPVATAPSPEEMGDLIAAPEAERMRGQWHDVQAKFVDDPRKAVAEADALVASAMDVLRERFESQRIALSDAWETSGDNTEALRMALRRYRRLFDSVVH